MISRFTRGMVYWVTLPNYYGDTVMSGRRPCIIVSNDVGNMFSENITIVPCTSNIGKDSTQPTHHTTRITKDTESIVLCENIMTISKKSADTFIGVLDNITMKHIDECIKIALGINEVPVTVTVTEQAEEPTPQEPKKLITKEHQKQYVADYDTYGVDYVVTKYAVASRSAAYQRYNYYKRRF
jgi:mRNA interferase MazF